MTEEALASARLLVLTVDLNVSLSRKWHVKLLRGLASRSQAMYRRAKAMTQKMVH